MNKIFYCSSFSSPCLWRLHQAAGNNEQLNDTRIWETGVWKKAVPCMACSLKADNKIWNKDCWTLFLVTVKYENPWLSFKRQYICLAWGMSKHWVYSTAFPLWYRVRFPHCQCKIVDFLKAQGAAESPLNFSLCTDCMDLKDVKGHREIKTKSQLYCLKKVGVERTCLN